MAIFNSYVSLPEGIPYQNHYYTIGDINQWSPAAFSSGCVRHPCCQLECWPLLSGWYPSVSGGCHNGHSIKPPNCTSKYEGYVGWTSFLQQILLKNIGPLLSDIKYIKWKGPAIFTTLWISQNIEFSNPVSRVFNVDHLWLLIALYDVDDTIWLFNMAMENPHF